MNSLSVLHAVEDSCPFAVESAMINLVQIPEEDWLLLDTVTGPMSIDFVNMVLVAVLSDTESYPRPLGTRTLPWDSILTTDLGL